MEGVGNMEYSGRMSKDVAPLNTVENCFVYIGSARHDFSKSKLVSYESDKHLGQPRDQCQAYNRDCLCCDPSSIQSVSLPLP
jgi:hypothetical protein